MRKVKVKLELNLARDIKKNRKSFYRYINQRRKVEGGATPLIKI